LPAIYQATILHARNSTVQFCAILNASWVNFAHRENETRINNLYQGIHTPPFQQIKNFIINAYFIICLLHWSNNASENEWPVWKGRL